MSRPISPRPLTRRDASLLPAYLSNGVIGLRLPQVPFLGGLAMLSGYAGTQPTERMEGFARAPFPLAADVIVAGIRLSDAPDHVRLVEQAYDFVTAELCTRLAFVTEAASAEIEIVTFCSRTLPTLVLQEIAVRTDRACDLRLEASVDETGVLGRPLARTSGLPGGFDVVDGVVLWESAGGLCRCGAAYATELEAGGPVRRTGPRPEPGPLTTAYEMRARRGRRCALRQIASLVPDAMHHEPDLQAGRLLLAGRLRGHERLRAENRRAWDELWLARIELLGADERWQAICDASLFYLQTSVHPSSPSSTSLFGLAYWPDYHYYRGHIMWDLDFFALPPLVLTDPESARALLAFRRGRLPAARANAHMAGRRGLQFPWESSMRYGEESTPADGAGAALEQHVSLDVALAFARFAHTSGDAAFRRDDAWPVLHGVAEWIASRVERTARGYELRGVSGIAEMEPAVDNDAFTNMLAIVTLREAASLARILGHTPPAAWEEIAARLVVPMDADGRRIITHDRYDPDEPKGATPDPLAGLFPGGYRAHPEIERETAAFYLERAGDYVGAPMLSPLLGTWAARAGRRAEAAELLERGYADFLLEPFTLIDEYAPAAFPEMPRAGPFTANIGAFLTGILYGQTGLYPDAGGPLGWCRGPVAMPSSWDGIAVERIWVRGRPARLTARHGDERPRLDLSSPSG